MMKKNRKLLAIALSLLCMVLGMVLMRNENIQKKDPEAYNIDEIVESIDDTLDVDVIAEKDEVSADALLDVYTNAMVYRLKDGNTDFPKYLKPSKIMVDEYDTLILCYTDPEQYQMDYDELNRDVRTLFAEKIALDDIALENVETMYYSKPISYIPDMFNSRAKAGELKSDGIKGVITIGIADTGLYSSDSKVAKYVDLKNSYDYVNNDSNVLDGIDEHATMVTSVLLDVLGTELAENNVRIINAKCLEYGSGSVFDVYRAICGLADSGCDIINFSIGGEGTTELEEFAVEYAVKKGCILIAAAGNESGAVAYPAAYDDVIAVSAIDKNREICDFSNYGKEVDICAPGEDIVVNSVNNTQALVDGTSFSAPAISAVVAMLKLEYSEIDDKDSAMKYLKKIAEDLGKKGKDQYYGCGIPVFPDNVEPPTTEKKTTEPVTEEPITEETTEPVTEEPTTGETTEPVAEEPTTEERTTEPVAEEPTTEETEPVTEEPTTEEVTEPMTEEPTTEKPTEEPTTKKPVQPKPSTSLSKVTGIWNPGISHRPDFYARYEWDALEGAVSYEIYRAEYKDYQYLRYYRLDELNWKYIGKTNETKFEDYEIQHNHDYFFKVRGIDADGNYGPFSNVIEVDTYMSSLNNLKHYVDGNTFKVSFDAHPQARGYEFQIENKDTQQVWYEYFDDTTHQVELDKGRYRISVLRRFFVLREDGIMKMHGGGDYFDIEIQ